MPPGSRDIVVKLSQHQLAAALTRGAAVVRAEHITLDPALWAEAWAQGLMPYDQPLRQLIARLGVRPHTSVTVLYQSPGGVLQVHDIAGNRPDAAMAGLAKLREAGVAATIADTTPVGKAASKPNSWTVIGVADRDEHANAIFAWVTRCGGRLAAILPLQAAVAQHAAAIASDGDPAVAHCVIGAEWSAIACGSPDGLRLVRVFELGHRTLTDVFHRVLSADSGCTRDDAEHTLFTTGLPFKSKDADPALRARVLPLVSPVLQRLCVEIKQTLRFGLHGSEAPGTLVLHGPGAAIPSLATALSEGVDMHVRAVPLDEAIGPPAPFGHATVERAYVTGLRKGLRLLPPAAARQNTQSATRHALIGGVAAAGVLIAAEFTFYKSQTRSLTPRFEQLAPIMSAAARERANRLAFHEEAMAAGRCAVRIHNAGGPRAAWPELLRLISSVSNDTTRFDSIDAGCENQAVFIEISGSVVAQSDPQAAADMNALVQRLTDSPAVAAVEFGATQREIAEDGRSTRRFSLTLRLHAEDTPLSLLAEHASERIAREEEGM